MAMTAELTPSAVYTQRMYEHFGEVTEKVPSR